MIGPYNFFTIQRLAEMKQQESQNEAELYRLAKQITPSKASLLVQAAWTVGSMVIAFGTWLQTRPGAIHYR